jgi:hypothetical protein
MRAYYMLATISDYFTGIFQKNACIFAYALAIMTVTTMPDNASNDVRITFQI